MIASFIYLLIGIGFLSLAWGWTLTIYWPVSIVLLVLTPLGWYLVKRKVTPTLSLLLALGTVAAAVGLVFKMPLFPALTGLLGLLAAWDLDGFSRRLSFAAPQDEPAVLELRHLLRVGLVLALGTGLSLVVLNIRLRFNFELAVGLVLLTFAGVATLINWLRQIER